jgi:hypothetical protein
MHRSKVQMGYLPEEDVIHMRIQIVQDSGCSTVLVTAHLPEKDGIHMLTHKMQDILECIEDVIVAVWVYRNFGVLSDLFEVGLTW